jgi:hypothetical protein
MMNSEIFAKLQPCLPMPNRADQTDKHRTKVD